MKKYINYYILFVELRTKSASVFPFLGGFLYYVVYLANSNGGIHWLNLFVLVIVIHMIDVATTALNHYLSFDQEKEAPSSYQLHILDLMKELKISMKTNRNILIIMYSIAFVFSIILFFITNIGVILLGLLCAAVGFFYSFGPKPIAHTPFGEIFSGGIQGIVMPVVVIFSQYNHLPWELNPFIALVFLPFAFLIGSIMLDNNICDLDFDITNNRYTLAYYLGKKNGVKALNLSCICTILSVYLCIVVNLLPWWFIICTIMIIPLFKNVKLFSIDMIKEKSFMFILKNYILFSLCYIVLFIVNIFIK
ncbi:MAG: prenyltransferase [Bacilli bacterium]|jgi:1,4-dihydroxy-2-naphthoate octaprenyltransferase|nr:prenyltransferase [Bacilli bacterium]